ncbi:uncharacterized protein LOC119081366 [Bradysia coprophila]|uniref:uncharacterized protein LOC119081366 n=1 Tax=Bradysia coprophila TaxID=38358 RepID=UPI00187D8B3B|nr:uncharacterized protein LOC119081366 [Bradysia coprophila]
MSSSMVFLVSMIAVFVPTNILQAVTAAEHLSKCSFTQKDATFSQFHPLSAIPDSQPDGFYAKVKVSVTSDYGDIHILLAESDDFENTNGYEFVSAPYINSEIRRRNSVYGKYEVLSATNISIEDYAPGITILELSVTKDGVIKVSVLSPNSTIASYDPSYLFTEYQKYRTLISNYSLETTDTQPFPINYISFSGHSKLQFNCDYGVFRDKALFVQTRCEAIYGWSQEKLFHAIESTDDFHPDGYYANVDISMLSDYGNLHVLLSETNEKTGPNPSYEIVIADRFGTESEFRRKNSISQGYDFVNQSSFTYNVKQHRSSVMMRISVSVDGVISFTDLDKNTTFTFTDTEKTIPVKYITFAGYRKWPATYEIDCLETKTICS